MSHGRGVNSTINNLDECLLRIVYEDNNSSFKELLKKDNCSLQKYSVTFHKIIQVKENLSNTIMNDILQTDI